jgi:hypothetical protein
LDMRTTAISNWWLLTLTPTAWNSCPVHWDWCLKSYPLRGSGVVIAVVSSALLL